MVRHFVKPGITGWSQVTGFRGETKELKDMEGRIRGGYLVFGALELRSGPLHHVQDGGECLPWREECLLVKRAVLNDPSR